MQRDQISYLISCVGLGACVTVGIGGTGGKRLLVGAKGGVVIVGSWTGEVGGGDKGER